MVTDLLNFCYDNRNVAEIVEYVVEVFGFEAEIVEAYINFLIYNQILVSGTGPGVTGKDYIERLLADVQESDGSFESCISSVIQKLNKINKPVLNVITDVNDQLEVLLPGISEQKKSVFYSGFERELSKGAVNEEIKKSIDEAIGVLSQILSDNNEMMHMDKFSRDFQRKFDKKVMPLLNALDPETGVGYGNLANERGGSRLLDELNFNKIEDNDERIEWSEGHRLLLKLWQGALNRTIEITDEDLVDFKPKNDFTGPSGMAVIFRIYEEHILLEQAAGITSTSLIARFGLFSDEVNSMAKELAGIEDGYNPDILFAEIVHLVDEHIDNINRRNHVRALEIPVLFHSELPNNQQISLNDLYVTVQNDLVILYSKRHNKRIIPRLSSAFNHTLSELPVFRFLCDLQYQKIRANFSFDLSRFFPGMTFYPRVQYKSVLLNLASWHLKEKELKFLTTLPVGQMMDNFEGFANRLGLPRYFSIVENDHQLVFDSKMETDILFFHESLKNKKSVILQEYLYENACSAVLDNNSEPYVNQFITCLYKEAPTYTPVNLKLKEKKATKRTFSPGSEWCYIKIYCHYNNTSEITSNFLLPQIKKYAANEKGQWFFIRYLDPEYHLRLRVKLPPVKISSFLSDLNDKLKNALNWGQIEKIQIDTYHRELERFGAGLIDEIEKVFCLSSYLVAAFIGKVHRNSDLDSNSIAIHSVNELVAVLFTDAKEKVDFLEFMYLNFFSEFGNNKTLKYQLDQKFRSLRNELENGNEDQAFFRKLKLVRHQNAFKNATRQLIPKAKNLPRDDRHRLIADIIHMHLNRIFTIEWRKQEMVVYYFLFKLNLAQQKKAISIV